MSKGKKNGKGSANVLELFARLRQVAAEQGTLEEEEKAIKAQLRLLIPVDKSVDGVVHLERNHVSTKWAQVYEKVVKELVPSTKRDAAQLIRETFTTATTYAVFEEEKV